ncbi:MAG TPA: FliA/WhiG family RNA polymerase sigma factor [Acidimicrobiales bacterium]|jgi:RNA polymerase sigma factor for flagellar operon FliA
MGETDRTGGTDRTVDAVETGRPVDTAEIVADAGDAGEIVGDAAVVTGEVGVDAAAVAASPADGAGTDPAEGGRFGRTGRSARCAGGHGRACGGNGRSSASQHDVEELWRRFNATGCEHALADLVTTHMPLVRFVAARLLPMVRQHVHHDALVEHGVIGLTEALIRFEPDRGIRFETFAVPRIRGSILDEIRSVDWTPRSVRTKARALAAAHEELQWTLHRPPTDAEVASQLEWSTDEVERVTLLIQRGSIGVIDDHIRDQAPDPAADPAVILEQQEERQAVRHAMVNLRDRERQVIELYYFEEYTLAQIAAVLGVTEGRVSQIRSRAVTKMTDRLWPGPSAQRPAS